MEWFGQAAATLAMGRRLQALALAVGLAACGSSSGMDDAGPSMQEDAATLDAALSCEELSDRWAEELQGLGSCNTASDCVLVGSEGTCEDYSINCGSTANGADYQGSTAAEIEREFFARRCESTVADCGVPDEFDCVDGTCRIVGEECCFCPPLEVGMIRVADVALPGHPELGAGALVTVEFADWADGVLPAYDDRRPPGDGCVVYVLDAAAPRPSTPLDGGTVSITGTLSPMPPCAFDATTMRYECLATSGTTQAGDALQVVGGGEVEVDLADAPFDASHVGMHLELTGAIDATADGSFPIVGYTSPTRVSVAMPDLASDSGWATSGTYAVVGGAGPTPASVDFLDDGSSSITIDKAASPQASRFSIDLSAAGQGFALDDASASLDDLPADGSATELGCDGTGGNCGAGTAAVLMVSGVTTNASVAGLSDHAMPTSTTGQIAVWQCAAIGAARIEVPADAMQAILDTNPTRIEATLFAVAAAVPADTDATWAVLVGHGITGYTTVPP